MAMKLYSDKTGYLYHVQSNYDCFVPRSLNDIKINFDDELIALLNEANYLLGVLNGISKNLPDKEIFIAKFVEKEAAVSSQIEGTQASLEDVFQINKAENEKRKEIEEIVNYVNALNFGIELLDKLPISLRFLKEVHKVLLKNTRGSEKNAGEFRKSQNRIGHKGANLLNASYIPPSPDKMKEALYDLENYINKDEELNPLIQIALIHYQFETIHPFLDGNGRVGRILIPLFLKKENLLEYPILYLSLYFKMNRSEYYELLMNVRFKGKVEEWIKFFLKAIIETSESCVKTIEEISKLKEEIVLNIEDAENLNKEIYFKTLDYIFHHPYFETNDLVNALHVSKPTALKIINTLKEFSVVTSTSNKKRYITYKFEKYVALLEEGTEI